MPTSVCSGVAWVSPRFWSPGRGDTLESAPSDAVERLFRTSRKSAPSSTSADKSVWGSTARRPVAQADRSNIHAGISSQRFTSDAVRSQRKTTPPASQLPQECRSAGRTMDATDTAVPEYCGRSQAFLYNGHRPHSSLDGRTATVLKSRELIASRPLTTAAEQSADWVTIAAAAAPAAHASSRSSSPMPRSPRRSLAPSPHPEGHRERRSRRGRLAWQDRRPVSAPAVVGRSSEKLTRIYARDPNIARVSC